MIKHSSLISFGSSAKHQAHQKYTNRIQKAQLHSDKNLKIRKITNQNDPTEPPKNNDAMHTDENFINATSTKKNDDNAKKPKLDDDAKMKSNNYPTTVDDKN